MARRKEFKMPNTNNEGEMEEYEKKETNILKKILRLERNKWWYTGEDKIEDLNR